MKRTIRVIMACAMLLAALAACDATGMTKTTPVPTSTLSLSPTPAQTPAPTPSLAPTAEPTFSPSTPPVAIKFKDRVVEKVIRTTLDNPEGPVTDQDMLKITSFAYDPVNDRNAAEGKIKTLTDLRYCVNLETLNVMHQPVKSIECLKKLDKIKDVCILGCSVSDLSPLAGKNFLTNICISGNPVKDASPVLALPNLIEFNAYWGTKVTDISALPAASSLEHFFCENKLKDFTPLLKLENLRSVTLSGISDSFFRKMIQKFNNMSSIRISYSDIKDESLKLLAGCNLYGLSLENCGLKDISGLAGLAGVSDLRLGGNQIKDISVLKNFTQISYCLDIRNNKIRDFSPLESVKLSSLWVMGNPYTKASKAVLNKLEKGGCRVYR